MPLRERQPPFCPGSPPRERRAIFNLNLRAGGGGAWAWPALGRRREGLRRGCGRLSRSPKLGQRTRRERGPRKQRQATSGSAGAVKPGLPPSREDKAARNARPRLRPRRAPGTGTRTTVEMAVKAEEGLRGASFSVLFDSGHPACETGAGGASLGCHLSRSIHDGRFQGTKKCATAGFGTAAETLPKMAAAVRGWGGRSPRCFRPGPGRGNGEDWYPWLPPRSPTRPRKR